MKVHYANSQKTCLSVVLDRHLVKDLGLKKGDEVVFSKQDGKWTIEVLKRGGENESEQKDV